MKGLVVDVRVLVVRVVTDVVLDLSHHVLRLNSLRFGHAHLRGKKGIFAESVVATSKLEIAVDVDERLKSDINAKRASFAADNYAIVLGILDAECRPNTHRGRLALQLTREHSWRTVREAKTRNAEARDTSKVSGLTLVDGRILLRTVNQRELLLERHPAEKLVHAWIARHHRDGLRRSARHCDDENDRSGQNT